MELDHVALKAMPFQDNSLDLMTSFAAFGNIFGSGKVVGRMYRTLKSGGALAIEGTYIEEGSRSFGLAKKVGREKGK